MGKWNYRRRWTPKNYYRDQRIPTPPSYYETEYQLRGAWKNVDLPWEERFCISVGIPWEKVLNTKKYMNSYDNVVNWNDSASEATFLDAKKRFWEKINDIPTPDHDHDHDHNPDLYNHDIDWNPYIDLDLVKDLDRAYFNPDDMHKVKTYDGGKSYNDDYAPGCILGLEEKDKCGDNPWEQSKNGWNCSNKSLNKNISDPWEQGIPQENKEIKNSGWGGGGGSWQKDMTWGGGENTSWQKVDDSSKKPWGSSGLVESGCGCSEYSQRHGANVGTSQGQRGNYRGGYSGRGQWHGQHNVHNNNVGGHERYNGSGWDSRGGCRKREGSQNYTSTYKSARFQYDDYREGGNRYQR